MSEKSKMYILVRRDLPPGIAAVSIAHASLGGYLHFVANEIEDFYRQGPCACPECGERDTDILTETEQWAAESFRKVVCAVTEEQFQEAKSYGVAGIDYRVMTESSLDKAEVAIVFKPRSDFESFFKALQLWGNDIPVFDPVEAGKEMQSELALAEGGSISESDLLNKQLIGIDSAASLANMRNEWLLVYWRDQTGEYHYPVWQFAAHGETFKVIQEVLKIFRSTDEWRIMNYFLSPRKQLHNRRPLDMIRDGEEALVLRHAKDHERTNTW